MNDKRVDPARVEVIKVWYSVFCTLVDAYNAGEYSESGFIQKMKDLRHKLIEEVPEVEAQLAKEKH